MKVLLELLQTGMITAEDVYALNGQLLVPKGSALTEAMIHKMRVYSIRAVRIADNAEEAAASENPADNDYMGTNVPGFTSKIPDEVRKARVQNIKEYKEAYSKGLNYFQVAVNNLVTKNTDADIDSILNDTLSMLDAKGKNSSILDMLIYMKEYDSSVYAHCINVSLLCNMLAHWLDYSEEDCHMAAACGMFHDIGKLAIPEQILRKPGPLTPEERNLVNTHPEKGYQMLEEYKVAETVKLSALMHHEFCDGSGYPRRLKAGQIDRFAKLVTICNIYDAMTSERPYRKVMSPFAVIEYFEGIGLQKFDTRPILTFLENTVNTYLNCPVRLSNGMVGYVVFINRERLGRPTVQCGSEFVDLSKNKDLSIQEMLPIV